VENVRLLLETGSNPNFADSRGGTPWLAAFQGRRPMPEIVSLLRQHGADNSRADQSGLSAEDYAQAFGDPRIMSLIR
jgi:ankyrin repeat protein